MGRNLLTNPKFEGEYTKHSDRFDNVWTAPGWSAFWLNGNIFHNQGIPLIPFEESQNPVRQPEYGRNDYQERCLEGTPSQMYFTWASTHVAGIMQRNVLVPRGAQMHLKFHVQAWCSINDDPEKSEREMYGKLAIRPGGGAEYGENPNLSGWQWGPTWKCLSPNADKTCHWTVLELLFMAEDFKYDILFCSWVKWKTRHTDLYAALADCSVVGAVPEPDPEPEPEPDDGVLRAWFLAQMLKKAEADVEYWRTQNGAVTSTWLEKLFGRK